MKEKLDDLKDLSGVNGACLFHLKNGVVGTNLPAIFTTEKLSEIAKLLNKLLGAGRMSFNDLTDLSLQYDESVILARGINDSMIIFLLCDPGINQNLITMSLNLLQQELETLDIPLQGKAAAPSAAPTAPPPAEDNVSPVLAQVREQLPQILGPMADFIFDDVVESWRGQGKYTLNDLPALINLLEEEIDNADQASRLRSIISPIISQAGRS